MLGFFMAAIIMGTLLYILVSDDPISMGFGLAIYSAVAAVLIGEEFSSYFGYLVFFVYVGTLMVMFCMVVSLAPNPKFMFDFVISVWLVYWGANFLLTLLEDWVVGFGEKIGLFPLMLMGEDAMSLSGSIFSGLGAYGGHGWGWVLVCLGLILMLSVISVANLSKRSSGPLVRFVSHVGGKFSWRGEM